MRGKILTISIAAYNVEQYIEQALDSLIDERIIDDLEIFVVDDGGTDRTLEIAKRYAERYPNSIFPIHKENGGYGSTVNYSIAHATGKYFKLLDGDDWFDKEGLYDLVTFLKNTNTDVVCTEKATITEHRVINDFRIEKNKEFNITDISNCDFAIGMWELTFKTSILLLSGIIMPNKILYTDQYYSTIPFSKAKTIVFINVCVYCYRMGRDGQSVSLESRRKHVQDSLTVCKGLCGFCESQKISNNENYVYILNRVIRYNIWTLKNIFLCGFDKNTKIMLMQYEKEIKILSSDVFELDFSCKRIPPKFVIMMRVLRVSQYKLFALLRLCSKKFAN